MSGDADDVLAAIDRALGDHTVSGDAMRWTPELAEQLEPEPHHPSSASLQRLSSWVNLAGRDAVTWQRAYLIQRLSPDAARMSEQRARELYQEAQTMDPFTTTPPAPSGPQVGRFLPGTARVSWDPEPWVDAELWRAANPGLPGEPVTLPPCQTTSHAGRRRGGTPHYVIVDEVAEFLGGAFDRLASALSELAPAARAAGRVIARIREAQQVTEHLADLSMIEDPDRPGRRTERRRGRQAQHSPYGPQPRKARR